MKKQFDRFILTDIISQGSDGVLYGGEERLPGNASRAITVKVLPAIRPGDPAERRFLEEVRTLASLAGNPYVVTFYGMGVTDGTPWIAMEQPMATLAGAMGPEPADPREVARMIECVARGVSALHSLSPAVLHNRLSPANVLVCAGSHYRVAEFGLASPATAEPTLSMESVRYAAPELLSREFGNPGPATDIYALGHLAYEMALGAKLHRAQFPAVWEGAASAAQANPARWQAWHHSIPTQAAPAHEVVRNFPPGLGQVIARMIAKPLSQRYASAEQVLGDIRNSGLAEAPVAVVPVVPELAAPPMAGGGFRPTPRGGFGAAPAAAAPPMAQPARSFGAPAPAAAAAPAAAMGAGGVYYVRLRNRVTGPFDLATLQRMSRQGQLSRLHQVSTDQRNWKAAGSVEGLFG